MPNQAKQRECARLAGGTTGLLVAEALHLPRQDGPVVGQVSEEDGALVFGERLGGGEWRYRLGHRATLTRHTNELQAFDPLGSTRKTGAGGELAPTRSDRPTTCRAVMPVAERPILTDVVVGLRAPRPWALPSR